MCVCVKMADVQDDDQWLYGDEKDETREDGEGNEGGKDKTAAEVNKSILFHSHFYLFICFPVGIYKFCYLVVILSNTFRLLFHIHVIIYFRIYIYFWFLYSF